MPAHVIDATFPALACISRAAAPTFLCILVAASARVAWPSRPDDVTRCRTIVSAKSRGVTCGLRGLWSQIRVLA